MAQSNSDDLAERIMQETNVPELRELCKEAGVTRDRGASKAETAAKLVREAPDAAYEYLGEEPPEPGYDVVCTCGLEDHYDDAEEAVEAASEHADDCRAWTGASGLGGLNVWSVEWGHRVWIRGEGWTDESVRDD